MIKQGIWAMLGLLLLTSAIAAAAGADDPKALFIINQGGKAGYMDRTGEMVIPPKFDRPWPFKGGLAEVIQGETEGYIDRNGKFIWPPGQLQEPPSPPPGELQPSPIKPPQKKEKLTYEDRQAWREILKWPERCGAGPGDGIPHPKTFSLVFRRVLK